MYKRLLTNPAEHDANNFVYIVHGIITPGFGKENITYGIAYMQAEEKIRRFNSPDEFFRASLIGRLDARTAKEKRYWHGGEISETGIFGSAGIIIEPALDELVEIAWNCDLGSPPGQEELKLFVARNRMKRRPPQNILGNTKGPYNEMIIRGHAGTEVKGIVYMEGIGEQEAQKLRYIAEKATGRKLPVIALPQKPDETYEGSDAGKKRERDFLHEEFEILQATRGFMEWDILGGEFSRLQRNEYIREYDRDFVKKEIAIKGKQEEGI